MFDFLKRNNKNDFLFPENYIDIHSHLIPGIDDGADSVINSIELIKDLEKKGIKNIITTPHILGDIWPNTPSTIEAGFELLHDALIKHKMDHINISYAAEYMLDEQFMQYLKDKNLLTLKKDYILIEMSYLNAPFNLKEMLFDIQMNGYTPILAHPERYIYLHNKFDYYYELKEMGCKFQMNTLSITGYYGERIQKCLKELIKNNLIDFIGSDTHHKRHTKSLEKLSLKKHAKLLNPIIENNQLFL